MRHVVDRIFKGELVEASGKTLEKVIVLPVQDLYDVGFAEGDKIRITVEHVESQKQKVTKDNYPILFETLEDVSHDAGAQAGHEFHELPLSLGGELDVSLSTLDKTLQNLTKDERNTFAVGEKSEVDALITKLGADGDYLDKVLEYFFHTL